ncbi:hypothetical protein EWH70_34695 [Amycolatopsis suaedae]|uniref:Cardiolipin synthase N-terminal domain-containing protein n=2 Tax=Amycolatopsis suaedae TaxID=2510978 RepID=A0A4Q7IZ60_9PSEU|nr:PLD nuclease N-terminal domain-containing protein [Amycolatopsis suaedae]RZQ59376.1 hypothetical protein EWH70_34695 [Amycolatopsis suaedae]
MALWIFCLVDVITTEPDDCRHLPKMGWLMIVLLLPTVGSLVWLFAGRPPRAARITEAPSTPAAPRPETDAEFRRRVRERAEQQRRAAREQQRKREEN